MNTTSPVTFTPARLARTRRASGLTLALVLGLVSSRAQEDPAQAPTPAVSDGGVPAATTPPKTYHLYVGADIEVPKEDAYYRMQRFTNYSAEVRVDGHAQRLKIGDLPSMRVVRDMKLSVDTATITDVRVERAYTAARDPFRTYAQSGLSGAPSTQSGFERNPNIPQPSRGGPSAGTPDLRFEAVEYTTRESFSNSGNAMADSAQFMNRARIEEGKEQYDAVEADFTVAASTDLEDCYLLLICEFKTDEKRDVLQRWMHLKTIGAITTTPRKIHLFDGGLPPGFELVAHEFHIYAAGREIATNLSDKRIELTEDEAFTFMNLQYVAAHRGETLPPVVVWAEVPPDLAERLPPDVLRWPIHVRVNAEGVVVGIAADEEGKRGAPKRVVDAIRAFRFNPALEKGKPVAGRVVVRIADFLPPLPE